MTQASPNLDFRDEGSEEHPLPAPTMKHAARVVLGVFLLTFIASRLLVILIMLRWIPDLFLHMGGTHVHHLNYGIFLLSGVGAYLLFRRPSGRHLTLAAIVYGIGLGLTFDEFGMWLHLGGGYWQRPSFDAVVVIASVLGLIAYAPALNRFGPEHWLGTLVLAGAVGLFFIAVILPLNHYARRLIPQLQQIEARGPQ